MTNHFSTLHCEYNFHLCGKLFIFFIYIIFQPLIFNQKLIPQFNVEKNLQKKLLKIRIYCNCGEDVEIFVGKVFHG